MTTENAEGTQPPRLQPRGTLTPEVPLAHTQAFSRPDGHDGSFDRPDDLAGAPKIPVALPSSITTTFSRPHGSDSLGKPPGGAPSIAVAVSEPVNPWSTKTAVTLGDAAVQLPEPEPEKIAPKMTVREALFGRVVPWKTVGKVAAAATAIAVVGGAVGSSLGDQARSLTSSTVELVEAPKNSSSDNVLGQVADQVQPAVVNISVTSKTASGEGSGVVIDKRGYVVTNHHVVSLKDKGTPEDKIEVIFSTGQTVPAELVGSDPKTDLAVLKVDVDDLVVAQLGSSSDVEVGHTVLAIGSPLGLRKTVTAGIVSAISRPISVGESGEDTVVIDALQTDAAINPGNSGGPLVDTRGAVVGINTSIFTTGGGSIGLGFAVPVDEVKRVVKSLITTGSIDHASLGVNARSATNDSVQGAELVNIREGSPADKGGLREGDVVIQVGERTVRSVEELIVAVRNQPIGEETTVVVVRDGREVNLNVTPN